MHCRLFVAARAAPNKPAYTGRRTALAATTMGFQRQWPL